MYHTESPGNASRNRRQLSIRARLLMVPALFTLTIIIFLAIAISQIDSVADGVNIIGKNYLPSLINLNDAYNAMLKFNIAEKNHIISTSDAEMVTLEEELEFHISEFNLHMEAFASTLDDGEERNAYLEFLDMWQSYLVMHDTIIELSQNNDDTRAQHLSSGEAAAIFNNAEELIDVIAKTNVDGASLAQVNAEQTNSTAPIILLITAIAGIIVATGVSFITIGNITGRLSRLRLVAQKIADGDMSQRVNETAADEVGQVASTFNNMIDNVEAMMATQVAKEYLESVINEYNAFIGKVADGNLTIRLELEKIINDSQDNADLNELGANLNRMVGNLQNMARQVQEVSMIVAEAAEEIQGAVREQTSSATEQNATVSQTASTTEEIRIGVVQSAEHAKSVSNASQESVNISRTGLQAVNDSVNGMVQIRKRVESIATNILQLSERTQQIGEIIEAVNALADQSKLLALNASIEAARAGDEGKGFAVVAMEVRQLAEQSREATGRVRDILSEIQAATNTAVMVTEDGSKDTDNGMKLVERAGEAIRQLAASLEEAAYAAAQIAASTTQQTNAMEQLASAMVQIRQASMQSATSAKQTEESVQNLTKQAQLLRQTAGRYQL